MSFFRSLSATLASAASVFSLVTASCSTGAVGVDDCRDIENARCRAGATCGIVDDVAACQRYYRDHCLHGLATAAPSRASVAECVQVIEAAGRCATDSTDTALASCQETVTAARPGLSRACDVVEHPERSDECAFLADVPAPAGGGGEGSGGDASDASSGDAGASDGKSGGATAG